MIYPTYDKIRPRRGRKSDWIGKDPVLLEGELGVEYPDDGISSGGEIKFKIGDGVNKWTDLPYCVNSSTANTIIGGDISSDNLISIKSGTTAQWMVSDPVIRENEIVFDSTLGEIKIGDGIHHFSELRYIGQTWESNKIYDFGDYDKDETI